MSGEKPPGSKANLAVNRSQGQHERGTRRCAAGEERAGEARHEEPRRSLPCHELHASVVREEGAVFVQVGIALFVLMAFNVFVLDYGVMWVARGAGAERRRRRGARRRGRARVRRLRRSAALQRHCGAAWRKASRRPTASGSNRHTGRQLRLSCWRDRPTARPSPSIATARMEARRSTRCSARCSASARSGVRATATASTGNGNATPCLRPWAFADDWHENRDLAPTGSEFNHYDDTGPQADPLIPDSERRLHRRRAAPYAGRTTVSADFGERIVWELDHALRSGNAHHAGTGRSARSAGRRAPSPRTWRAASVSPSR